MHPELNPQPFGKSRFPRGGGTGNTDDPLFRESLHNTVRDQADFIFMKTFSHPHQFLYFAIPDSIIQLMNGRDIENTAPLFVFLDHRE